jgi:hypothetical protein
VALVVVALLNLAVSGWILWAGVRWLEAAGQEENAGVGIIALVLLGFGLGGLGISGWLASLARRTTGSPWVLGLALAVGLVPSAVSAPFLLDAYRWSTKTVTLACSNLHRGDPRREVAMKWQSGLEYFELLKPWFSHPPDTRYQLKDAAGDVMEFRLKCSPRQRCVVRGATEEALRAAVEGRLPKCPPPK